MQLILDGYRPIRRKWPVYTLDTDTCAIETKWFKNQTEARQSSRVCGYGDFRVLGYRPKRRNVFIAIYAHADSLYLWTDGLHFDLLDEKVEAQRRKLFISTKCFRVLVDGRVIWKARYSYWDYEDMPDEDIFWYVARSAASMNDRLRALFMWQDLARGVFKDAREFNEHLTERIAVFTATHSKVQPLDGTKRKD